MKEQQEVIAKCRDRFLAVEEFHILLGTRMNGMNDLVRKMCDHLNILKQRVTKMSDKLHRAENNDSVGTYAVHIFYQFLDVYDSNISTLSKILSSVFVAPIEAFIENLDVERRAAISFISRVDEDYNTTLRELKGSISDYDKQFKTASSKKQSTSIASVYVLQSHISKLVAKLNEMQRRLLKAFGEGAVSLKNSAISRSMSIVETFNGIANIIAAQSQDWETIMNNIPMWMSPQVSIRRFTTKKGIYRTDIDPVIDTGLQPLSYSTVEEDFASEGENELSVNKGEVVALFENLSQDWCYVRVHATDRAGFIPSCIISRTMMRTALAKSSCFTSEPKLFCRAGDVFLVRDDESEDVLAIENIDGISGTAPKELFIIE